MQFRYEIYPDARAIVARISGSASLTELMTFIRTLWSDPRYSPAFDGIMDLSAQDVHVEMCEFRPILEYLLQSPHTSTGRWAAVATTPLATACGLIYRRALSARHGFEVFSTGEAAFAYLGFRLAPGDLFAEGNRPERWALPPRGVI